MVRSAWSYPSQLSADVGVHMYLSVYTESRIQGYISWWWSTYVPLHVPRIWNRRIYPLMMVYTCTSPCTHNLEYKNISADARVNMYLSVYTLSRKQGYINCCWSTHVGNTYSITITRTSTYPGTVQFHLAINV